MSATIAVDVDHVLATPIYDPLRCSINFHPLHGLIPIIFYGVLSLIPKTSLIGLGLLIHMALDSADCFQNQGVWYTPPAFWWQAALPFTNYYGYSHTPYKLHIVQASARLHLPQ